MTSEDLTIYGDLKYLQEFFGENIPCKMKAEVDLKTIEAIMLTIDEEMVRKIAKNDNFVELLTKELVLKFKN